MNRMLSFPPIDPRARLPLLIGGGLCLVLLVYWLPAPAPEDAASGIELSAPSAAPAPQPAPSPAPPPARAPSVSPEGLKLHGVLGGAGPGASAIIGRSDGVQMLVWIGRAVLPGVVLAGIERDGAILSQDGRTMRLSLVDGSGASRLTAMDAPVVGNSGGDYVQKDPAAETVDFRLALAPRQEGGQITGYAVKPGSDVELFRRAGLQPGDIVTEVNGRAFASEAEVNGLSREIGLSAMIVLTYERNGRRDEARVKVAK